MKGQGLPTRSPTNSLSQGMYAEDGKTLLLLALLRSRWVGRFAKLLSGGDGCGEFVGGRYKSEHSLAGNERRFAFELYSLFRQ